MGHNLRKYAPKIRARQFARYVLAAETSYFYRNLSFGDDANKTLKIEFSLTFNMDGSDLALW